MRDLGSLLMALAPSARDATDAEVAALALRWGRRAALLNLIGCGHVHWYIADSLAELVRDSEDPGVQATLRKVTRRVEQAHLRGFPGLFLWLVVGLACFLLVCRGGP